MEFSNKGPRAAIPIARRIIAFVDCFDDSDDVFKDGVHKGQTIRQLLIHDPGFIKWLSEKNENFRINPIIFEKLKQENIYIDLPLEIITKVQERYKLVKRVEEQYEKAMLDNQKYQKNSEDLTNNDIICELPADEELDREPIVPNESKIQPIQEFVAEEKKHKRNATQIVTNEFNPLTQEQKNESGGLGEEIAYRSIINEFYNKYKNIGCETNMGEYKTTLTNGGFVHAEIIWVSKIEKFSKYDILVIDKLDGEFFYEVKSTFSSNKDWFDISNNEWEFAQEKGDKYHILRVSDVKSREPLIMKYTNPYKLLQQGRISIKSIQLEL